MPGPERASNESFRAELERLVDNFGANEAEYTSTGYPEAQVRTDFITPFFRALGWDVENRAGLPYSQRDVIEEKGAGEGQPDYTFRTGGIPRFFVEAKAPHENLDTERHVLQAKRYAWSTKEVFAVVLTDFDEFRFYDASLEPDPKHPHHGLIDRFHLSYRQYIERVDDLWEFPRERVAAGSLEALLPRDKRSLRFRKPVDDRFLEDVTHWRTELAKAVHKHNPELDARALTDVVQRLLDRLIFIRVAEDRRVMQYRSLWEPVQDWKAMGGKRPLLPMLNELFHQVNEDFNGDIFKYHLCEEIKLGDWSFGKIIEQLYPPNSPYRFDVIPVDLFGAVYERYLGKTVHVRGKDVKVEDKPEVRKAGGVYYTPKFIVDYIVKNTVGKLIQGKSPKEIEKIRTLDPACGSGSFLIGAFQYLIDHHVAYYEKHPREASAHPLFPEVVKDGNGTPHLSIHRKAKILRNNLFGLDLDAQAVEITMMNLYLKALEGERDLPQKQHLLPELSRNIRCGNSLIAPDIAQQQKMSLEELERLNAFDWHSRREGFGDILATGGFDAVIGDPPYVSFGLRGVAKAKGPWAEYLRAQYTSAEYKLSLYAVFLQKGASLLTETGRLGFITPDSFLLGRFFLRLRDYILTHCKVSGIALFQEDFWESGVVGRPTIVLLERCDSEAARSAHKVRATHFPTLESTVHGGSSFSYSQTYFENTTLKRFRLFFSKADFDFVTQTEKQPKRLAEIVSLASGLIGLKGQQSITSSRKINPDWYPGLLSGSEITAYAVLHGGGYICFKKSKLKSGYKEARAYCTTLRKTIMKQAI